MEATARIPSPLTYGELQLDPWWDSLRKDPRFEKGRGAARAKTFDAVAIPALFSFSLKSITMRWQSWQARGRRRPASRRGRRPQKNRRSY